MLQQASAALVPLTQLLNSTGKALLMANAMHQVLSCRDASHHAQGLEMAKWSATFSLWHAALQVTALMQASWPVARS